LPAAGVLCLVPMGEVVQRAEGEAAGRGVGEEVIWTGLHGYLGRY
jgi:hypothetical protein